MKSRKLLVPVVMMGCALSGCGGGGIKDPPPVSGLSLSGRNRNGFFISLQQSSASIASGQGNTYTLTVKNDGSRTRDFSLFQDPQGTSPASLSVEDAGGKEVFDFPDLNDASLISQELRPNQSVSRRVTVPASVLARGTYRVTGFFLNNFADASADALGPLQTSVR